ncbi:MAG TPA: DMT family transporter [Actinomycetota bacterium]
MAKLIQTSHGTRSEAFGPVEWGLLASIALMWGSSFLWIAIGLEGFEPGLIAFLRVALGASFLGLMSRARRGIEREDWPRVALLGLVWVAIPFTLFPVAQQWIDSSTAGMINGAMPLFTAVVATLLLRTMPGARQLIGLAVGFAGVVLVSLPAAGEGGSRLLGIGLVLLATILYGLAANLAVPLQQKYGALPVVWRAQLASVVAMLPYGLISIPGSSFRLSSLGAVLILGFLSTGVALVAMAVLVGRAGATRGALAIYFIPVVATILGVVFRDETVEPVVFAGIALIIAGAGLASRRERRREPVPAPA